MTITNVNDSAVTVTSGGGGGNAGGAAVNAVNAGAAQGAGVGGGGAGRGVTGRSAGRLDNELRPISITRNYLDTAEGSVLVEFGRTKVLCNATFENKIPRWKKFSGDESGWVTAEYAMLPRATADRMSREAVRGKLGGRTHEISRLVGRALRAAVDMDALGGNTITIDCDVLQADGGTRTASITGAYVALYDAINNAYKMRLTQSPEKVIVNPIAAVSVGIVEGKFLLDLDYSEDSNAEVDLNVIMTSSGDFVEVQGTAEGKPFSKQDLDKLIELATKGNKELAELQQLALQK